MTEPSAPVGRPTKYDPAYCEQIIACMARGYSKTAFAGEIGVSRDTVVEWAKVHDEFSVAVKIAEAARVKHLETGLLMGETGPKVTSFIFALKNADPQEWRDKQEREISGSLGIRHEDALSELE